MYTIELDDDQLAMLLHLVTTKLLETGKTDTAYGLSVTLELQALEDLLRTVAN
jgi:hypothetical protein